MKKSIYLCIVFGILFSGNQLFSQTKNNYLRLEMGRAFTGSGDLGGNGFGAEFGKQLTKADRISLGYSAFNFSSYYSLENDWAHAAEMGYYHTFFNSKKVRPEIGLGFYTRYWKWNYDNAGYYEKYSTIGYTGSLGVNFYLAKNTCINLRGVLQNDNNADIVWSARFGMGMFF